MKKTTWILGGVSGVLVLVGSLGPIWGKSGSEAGSLTDNIAYLMMLLAAIGAILAMVAEARKNREAKFGGLIKTGLLTSLITALICFVGCFVFFQWLMPADFLENLTEAHIQQKALKFTDEAKRTAYLASAQKDKALYATPAVYSAMQALSVFMLCLAPVAVCGYVIFRIKGRPKPAK